MHHPSTAARHTGDVPSPPAAAWRPAPDHRSATPRHHTGAWAVTRK